MKAEYNSKLDKNMEDFVRLRIEGKTFDEIAKELKTTKQTLIEWNKKKLVKNAVDQGKVFKMNAIVKAYEFDLSNRAKTYLELSKKINDELLSRDLKDVGTDTLLKMSLANDTRVSGLIRKTVQIGKHPMIEDFNDVNGYFNLSSDE